MATARLGEFRCILRQMIDVVGVDRIMWGTDSPAFDVLISFQSYIKIMKDLTKDSSDGINFTKEEVDAILGGNAKRILGL